MNARQVVDLLRDRHKDDVFVPECKDGPTWGGEHLRLDAWAMRRSWTRPASFGYEVKVARSDWLRDGKIDAYLPLVSELYVVAPRGVLTIDELPAGVGFLEVAATGRRLLTKRKARAHAPDPEAQRTLLQYVLMSRAKIEAGAPRDPSAWRRWVDERREFADIGHRVSRRLRELYERDVEDVRGQLAAVAPKLATIAAFEERLRSLGVRFVQRGERWMAEEVAAHAGRLPDGARRRLERIVADLREFAELLPSDHPVSHSTADEGVA